MEFDFPLEELRKYRPEVTEPEDFDGFWTDAISQARKLGRATSFDQTDPGLPLVEAWDVSFSGHGGDAIKAWLIMPKNREGRLPAIVEYIGYGGGRSLPHDWLSWACAGYAHFVMDCRGQGSNWSVGDTPDPSDTGTPAVPGFMTRGIEKPESYYYVRLFVDAVRAIDAVREFEGVDPTRVIVNGGSQGGGLGLAAAGLAEIQGVMCDTPFLAHFRRAVKITSEYPYGEIVEYGKFHRDQLPAVFNTLSYVDVVNHAKRATCPALFSVGLTDMVTPPSTVFAAYNWYGGPKQIEVYEFNGHEGGGTHHHRLKLAFAREVFGSS